MREIPPFDPDAPARLIDISARARQAIEDMAVLRHHFELAGITTVASRTLMSLKDDYRRAFLSQFETFEDYETCIQQAYQPGKVIGFFELTVLDEIQQASRGAYRVPYGQPGELDEPVFSDPETIRFGIREFSGLNSHQPIDLHDPGLYSRTVVSIEPARFHLNICFSASAHNSLPFNIHAMADRVAHDFFKAGGTRKPVQVFLHRPPEYTVRKCHQFQAMLEDDTELGENAITLDALPRAIDYGYFQHQNALGLPDRELFAMYDEWRGFALRVL